MFQRLLTLQVLRGELAICRLEASQEIPVWAQGSALWSVTRTPAELAVVCDAQHVPEGVRAERGWRGLAVQGPLEFGAVGILASMTGPLAEQGVSLFVISTFDTDYILVKDQQLQAAIAALRAAGHRISED